MGAEIDKLRGQKKFTKVVQVEKLTDEEAAENRKKAEAAAKSAQALIQGGGDAEPPTPSTSRASTRGEDPPANPLKALQNVPKEGKGGKRPHQYATQYPYRGASEVFCLQNAQELAKLTEYLGINGKYEMVGTPKDGNCLFNALRAGTDLPQDYVTILFKRQIVVLMCQHADFILPLITQALLGTYGHERLSREEYLQKTKDGTITAVQTEEYQLPGPFSYITYMEHLLKDNSWGDEIVLTIVSFLWQLCITCVTAESLLEHRIRHDRPLEQADLVVVYCGQSHYIGAGKYLLL